MIIYHLFFHHKLSMPHKIPDLFE